MTFSAASRACASVSAITTATGSPTWQALPLASAGCGAIFIGEPSLEWIIQPQMRLPILSAASSRAGEHREHARHAGRGLGVDRFDRGVGVRRADEIGIGLAGPVDVVGVVALAGDEAAIFLAAHRGADTGRAHGSFLRQSCSDSCVDSSLPYSAACVAAPLPRMARAPAAIALTMLW